MTMRVGLTWVAFDNEISITVVTVLLQNANIYLKFLQHVYKYVLIKTCNPFIGANNFKSKAWDVNDI